MRIRDLVDIPPVRTVVRLADLADPSLRRHMVKTFVLTGEVSFVLTTVLEKIAGRQGRGFFVIGNYGSGKSHLLNILSLLLADTEEQENFLATYSETETGDRLRQAAVLRPLAVEISLVEHGARENLEQIVLSRIAEKLRSTTAPSGNSPKPPAGWLEMPRPEAFQSLREMLAHGGWGGLLLLIDELSEFLRSKEDPRTYNEDIRFLQFLGEFAENIPSWIIATMQENIENTGALSGEMLHKIKDRYPVRFRLSGEHVKEIVSRRLVRKKPAAAEALPEIYKKLQQSFGQLPFSRFDFNDLYPVHPSTVKLLDELRPLFSQHRGVIDFIHYRLAGDRSRGIDSLLEKPAHFLLTPDYIFDHFRDRLRETVETNPYSEQVYRHFEREAENIFDDPADAPVGLSLLKLLILGALAPAPKAFTATELTRLLLYCYNEVESTVNYEYIAELLELMQTRGAYITTAQSKDRGKTVYTIDLKADMSLLLQKKLDYVAGAFTPGDPKIIEGLLPWIDESHLPLSRLQQEAQLEEEISWQNTRRRGKIIYGVPTELSADYLEELRGELETTETDFLFFLYPPAFAVTKKAPAAGSTTHERTGETGTPLHNYMTLWVPREILASEETELRRAYACRLLQEEYAADESPVGRQVKKQLETRLAGEKQRVGEIFRQIYTEGKLQAAGEALSLSSLAYLPFFALVSQCAAEILKARFPRHLEICPRSEQFSTSLLQRALDLLSTSPMEEGTDRGIQAVIENYLQPLGLVRKKSRNWRLELNPKTSPLLARFFSFIPETSRAGLSRVYWKLRKGPFGLSKEGFQILTAAAVLSGAVSAYQGGRKLAPSQVNIYQLDRVNELGPGTLIRPELQKVLSEIPFLPARLRTTPLTFFSQQQAWETVTLFKDEWGEKLQQITGRLERLKEYHLFATVDWRRLGETLRRFQEFLNEIKVSYNSQEGLERFLAAFQARPLLTGDFQRLETLADFLAAGLPEILRLGHYLKDPALALPTEKRYQTLRRRRRLILELLADEAIFWEKTAREKAEEEFRLFLAEYIPLYLEEHETTVGRERLQPYRDLMTSGAYRLLERLGKLNAVVVKDDIISINRELAPLLERECGAAEEPLLQDRPTCSCGFRLGEKAEIPEIPSLRKRILLGIGSYLAYLHEEEPRRRLTAYAEHLEMVGRRREAAPLRELLKTAPGEDEEELLSRLEGLITQSVVAHLNRALTGDAIIAERYVTELQEMLADRVFTVSQLKDIFETWLTGNGSGLPEYIRVAGDNKNNLTTSRETAAGEVKIFLQKKFPRLVPLGNRLGETNLLALALLTFWFIYHNPTAEQLQEDEDGAKAACSLAGEYFSLPEEEWLRQQDDLVKLGETVLAEKEILPQDFLEEATATVGARLPAARLLDLYYQGKPTASFRFESLLKFFLDEPFFPAVNREIATRLAEQISAEKQLANLRGVAASLREALKNLEKNSPVLTPDLLAKKKETLSFLETMASANLLLCEIERAAASPPGEDKGWERFYRSLSPFELLQGRVEESPLRALISGTVLKDRRRQYAGLLEPLLKAFENYYRQKAPSHRQTLRSLLRQLPGWATHTRMRTHTHEGGNNSLFLLLLDGARLDLWNVLLEKILAGQKLTLLREGLLWATAPTVTKTQLQPLQEEGLLERILHVDERLVAEVLSDPGSLLPAADNSGLRPETAAPLTILKLDYVDEKIHTSRDPLPVLAEETWLQTKKRLLPLLNSFPAGSLILLAADHGFTTNLHLDKSNKEEPLYLHGGTSFFEVLAPWSLLQKT